MNDEERFQELRENEINRLIESGDSADPRKGILADELILSEENNIEGVIEEMDNLINSVKEYNQR